MPVEDLEGLYEHDCDVQQSAHNEETVFALYERSQTDLIIIRKGKLKDPALRTEIKLIAARLGMVVDPYEVV